MALLFYRNTELKKCTRKVIKRIQCIACAEKGTMVDNLDAMTKHFGITGVFRYFGLPLFGNLMYRHIFSGSGHQARFMNAMQRKFRWFGDLFIGLIQSAIRTSTLRKTIAVHTGTLCAIIWSRGMPGRKIARDIEPMTSPNGSKVVVSMDSTPRFWPQV